MPKRLEDLLTDESDYDREGLAAALIDVVRIGHGGELLPAAGWTRLSQGSKVLIALLASKAGAALGVRSPEGLTGSEVEALTQVPGGTVRPQLRQLAEEHLAQQAGDGRYFIPAMSVPRALSRVAKERTTKVSHKEKVA
jgi:hypothetical protein